MKPSYLDPRQSEFTVELCEQQSDLVRAHFQSRHSSSKVYCTTIRHHHQPPHIREWYCTCIIGCRVMGCCAHVTALVWHLGVERAIPSGNTDPLSTTRLPNSIDNSTSLEEFNLEIDNNGFYSRISSSSVSSDMEDEKANDTST